MRVVVTGAAGMIGANLVHGLNAIGIDDVDRGRRPDRRRQVRATCVGASHQRLLRPARLLRPLRARRARPRRLRVPRGRLLRHDGARRPLMLDLNYRCSKTLLDACQAQGTRLLYASSAAVYGGCADVPRGARVRAAAQRLRLLQAAVRPGRAPHAAGGDDAGRGLSLLQRLRPARAAQGPHGVGRVPPFQPVPRDRPGQAVRRLRRLRARRAARDFVCVDDVVAVNLWFLAASARRAASSTSAPAARSRSTTSPLAVVNACARRARRGGAAARGAGRAPG